VNIIKILWITNTIFPAPSKALGLPEPVTGGWMYGLLEQLSKNSDASLAIASTYLGKEVKRLEIDGIVYYLLPVKSRTAYSKNIETDWKNICTEFKPGLVHIHGTEFPHGLACMRACEELKYLISIQGLVALTPRYCYAGMTAKDILRNLTFRDIVRNDTIFHEVRRYWKKGVFAREYIKRAGHIIGRTSWDYAHVKSVNPDVNYHFCNESLRDSFYKASKWDISQKKNYSIFLSQAYRPLKGAHQVIKSAGILKKDFPAIKIRLAGPDVIKYSTFSQKLKITGYGSHLRKLIDKYDLHSNIEFLGSLNEQRMIEEYRSAHIFICPSSIENSPNSLGEAQFLGAPSIASYVGGTPDMVVDGQTGLLFRFEEVEMLAESIRRIFTDDQLALRLSKGGIKAAAKWHNRNESLGKTIQIYHEIIGQSEI
jgi:glycosyltransferase involved in cell wall biosynthesis